MVESFENPPKIDRIRYFVRLTVEQILRSSVARPTFDGGYTTDGAYRQVIRTLNERHIRYIKVVESLDEARRYMVSLAENAAKTREGGRVHGSVQAFFGKVTNLKLMKYRKDVMGRFVAGGGGGSAEGLMTKASRIFSSMDVRDRGGLSDFVNRMERAFDQLQSYRMREYKDFTPISRGWKKQDSVRVELEKKRREKPEEERYIIVSYVRSHMKIKYKRNRKWVRYEVKRKRITYRRRIAS